MATHPTTFVSLGSRPSRGSVFAAVALALAIAGSGIAAYLASQNLQGETGVCTITHGCSVVQKSAYGRLFGVPVSVPGLGLYIALAVAAGIRLSGIRGHGPPTSHFSGASVASSSPPISPGLKRSSSTPGVSTASPRR